MSKTLRKIEPSRKYNLSAQVRSITGILDALDEIKLKIIATNPLEERINRVFKPIEATIAKNRTIYKRMISFFQITFTIQEPLVVQRKVGSCITALQIAWDDSSKTTKFDENKNFQFTVVKGALTKLFQMINPFSNVLDVRTKDDTHLLKLFAALDTILSALASMENDTSDPANNFIKYFKELGESDQKAFIVTNWQPKFFSDLDANIAKESFQLLLADPSNQRSIRGSDLLKMFEHLDESNRNMFIRQLFPLLLPPEKRIIYELIDGKNEVKANG